MRLSKQQILKFMRDRGDDEHAERAASELPDPVEYPRDAGQLAHLGISEEDLGDPSVWEETP